MISAFRQIIPSCALVAGLILVGACSPYQPKVEVEAAEGFAERGHGSWNYLSPLGLERAGYSEAVVDQVKAAVEESMAARGYRRASEPDLVVNITADIRDEGDATQQSDAYQAIHSNTGTFHDSWRGYGEGFGNSTRQGRYGSGRMNVGLIDRESRALVWEAVAEGRLSGQRSDAALIELMDRTTRQLLEPLPAASP